MRASNLVLTLTALAFVSPACLAEGNGGRYTMSPADGGFVRLDTETGAMALCTRRGERWSCEDMADGQSALMAEIDKLRAENKSLKAQVEQLEETLGLGENDTEGPKPGNKFTLPSEADVDKAFDYLEGMLKKLHERMEKLHEQQDKDGGTAL